MTAAKAAWLPSPTLLAGVCWLGIVLLQLAVHVGDWRHLEGRAELLDPAGRPLLHEYDSYRFLRQARELAEGTYTAADPLRDQVRPIPPRLLPQLAAWIAQAFGVHLELVAFYLPPVLASLLLAMLYVWGRLLDEPGLGCLAALASLSAFTLYARTSLGVFDLDCLSPLLVLAAPLPLYLFSLRRNSWGGAWLVVWAAVAGLFYLWWPNAAVVTAGLSLLGYGLSFPCASPRWERWAKLALLALLAVSGVLLALELAGRADTGIRVFGVITGHLRSLTSGAAAVVESSQSLAPQRPSSVFLDLSANPLTVLLAEVGLVGLVVVHRRLALFLLPSLALATASVFSLRLSIFAPAVYGLGYGFFLVLVTRYAPWVRNRAWAKAALPLLLAALLAPSLARNLRWHGEPPITARDLPLATAVRDMTSPDSTVWAWWDYGYFLQYFAKRHTVLDGGMLSEEGVRALAVPLASRDPLLAARWMRFMAAQSVWEFMAMSGELGGVHPAGEFLAKALEDPARAGELIRKVGLARDPDWPALLRQDAEVSLYLNRNTIDVTYWWYTFGVETLLGPERVPRAIVDRKLLSDFAVNYSRGDFTRKEDGGQLTVAEVVDVRRSGIARYPAALESGIAAVVYRDENLVYFVDREILETLAFRLLYAPMDQDAPGFSRLYRDPVAGGVWRVDLR